jgi:hypothetical protein
VGQKAGLESVKQRIICCLFGPSCPQPVAIPTEPSKLRRMRLMHVILQQKNNLKVEITWKNYM